MKNIVLIFVIVNCQFSCVMKMTHYHWIVVFVILRRCKARWLLPEDFGVNFLSILVMEFSMKVEFDKHYYNEMNNKLILIAFADCIYCAWIKKKPLMKEETKVVDAQNVKEGNVYFCSVCKKIYPRWCQILQCSECSIWQMSVLVPFSMSTHDKIIVERHYRMLCPSCSKF